MIDEQQELLIPPNPVVDARAAEQDFYRGIVEGYRTGQRRQRRRKVFRQILWTMYFAVITSAALIYVLRAVGLV
jgi:hypothetical protein